MLAALSACYDNLAATLTGSLVFSPLALEDMAMGEADDGILRFGKRLLVVAYGGDVIYRYPKIVVHVIVGSFCGKQFNA